VEFPDSNAARYLLFQVKMQCEISQSVVRLLVVVLVVSLAAVSAKPPHFQENAQVCTCVACKNMF